MKTLITVLVAAGFVVIVAVVFAFSGFYDVGASSPHGVLTDWLFSTTSHASVERRARDIVVPDFSDAALARAGVNDFNAMCTGCHGAPGQEPEAVGQGLNPAAPDLAESAAEMKPAELFWVTKHGIRMTGMPAWGATHEDDALWPVVAFLTKLPELDADGYQAFLASATGMGHHESGDDSGPHEHGDDQESHSDDQESHGDDQESHSDDEPAPVKNQESHDDGHDHQH